MHDTMALHHHAKTLQTSITPFCAGVLCCMYCLCVVCSDLAMAVILLGLGHVIISFCPFLLVMDALHLQVSGC